MKLPKFSVNLGWLFIPIMAISIMGFVVYMVHLANMDYTPKNTIVKIETVEAKIISYATSFGTGTLELKLKNINTNELYILKDSDKNPITLENAMYALENNKTFKLKVFTSLNGDTKVKLMEVQKE